MPYVSPKRELRQEGGFATVVGSVEEREYCEADDVPGKVPPLESDEALGAFSVVVYEASAETFASIDELPRRGIFSETEGGFCFRSRDEQTDSGFRCIGFSILL